VTVNNVGVAVSRFGALSYFLLEVGSVDVLPGLNPRSRYKRRW
jgi:hypothetical protein